MQGSCHTEELPQPSLAEPEALPASASQRCIQVQQVESSTHSYCYSGKDPPGDARREVARSGQTALGRGAYASTRGNVTSYFENCRSIDTGALPSIIKLTESLSRRQWVIETKAISQKQNALQEPALGSRRGRQSTRGTSPAILLPNDLQHTPHHIAHGGLGWLRCCHPPALRPDQIHQLP